MELLAPSTQPKFDDSHPDWYRQYKHSGGLASPRSSTSHTSLHDSWALTNPTTAMSSAKHVASGPNSTTASPEHAPVLPPLTVAKPSLPPIRSLLAEPFASPPATPMTYRQSLQITPPESDGDSARAHKRQRSSLAWESRPSHTSSTSYQPALPPMDFSQRRDSATQPSADMSSYRLGKDPRPLQHPLQRSNPTFLPQLRTWMHEPRTTSPERLHALPRPSFSRKRSFDGLSGPNNHDRAIAAPPPAPWPRPSLVHPAEARPAAYRPRSPVHYRAYPVSASVVERPDFQSHVHPRPHPAHYSAYPDPSGPSGGAAYNRPGAYDYQLAKARKRSNLPKESTDIMKRWFEDHLDNPYPSEDDKRYFAQKAGINLTQVSNWFINHRRRCPELREQRDKKQTTGRGTASESP